VDANLILPLPSTAPEVETGAGGGKRSNTKEVWFLLSHLPILDTLPVN